MTDSALYIKHWRLGKWLLHRVTDIHITSYTDRDGMPNQYGPWLIIRTREGLHPMKGKLNFLIRWPKFVEINTDLTKKLRSFIDFKIDFQSTTTGMNAITVSGEFNFSPNL